jgi:hypothetical protein
VSRFSVERPGTREPVPTTLWPNLRDHGRTVDASLLRILGHLQARYGEAFATEAGLRKMFCEDEGHMPGVDTVPKALRRLEAQGLLEQRHLVRGGILPDGQVCSAGARLIVLHQLRDRRTRRAWASARERVTGRIQRSKAASLDAARSSMFTPQASRDGADDRQRQADAKRAADLVRLAALAKEWKPPD